MINIIRFIPIQLFCIYIFLTIFAQCKCNELPNEIKIAIHWSHFPELDFLYKLAAKSEGQSWKEKERFTLRLFRVSYEMDRQFGRVIEPPIASGKTERYDFATLKITPPQQIGAQNVGNLGEREVDVMRRRAKGKGIAGMEKSQENINVINSMEGGEFELYIKMNFTWKNQLIIKRLKKLPNESQILICHFDANPRDECHIHIYNEKVLHPERSIFFQMNLYYDLKILQFKRIECTQKKGEYLNPLNFHFEPNGHGLNYYGPVCPFDEYTFHFILKRQLNIQLPYNCDEAIYAGNAMKSNIYQLKNNPDGTLECKLLLIDEFEDGKNPQKLAQQIGESERQIHEMEQQMQPFLWHYFYKQIETFKKTEQKLEEDKKNFQYGNLPIEEKTQISNEIERLKFLQAQRESLMPTLIDLMNNWQHVLMKVPSNSESSNSAAMMKELKRGTNTKSSFYPSIPLQQFDFSDENMTKLLNSPPNEREKMIRFITGNLMKLPLEVQQHAQSSHQSHPIPPMTQQTIQHAFTSAGPNQSHLQYSQTGTQTHLSGSSNVLRSAPDISAHFLYRALSSKSKHGEGNSSQSKMMPLPKEPKSSKHSQRKKVRVSAKVVNPVTIESQPETTSIQHDQHHLEFGLGLPSAVDSSNLQSSKNPSKKFRPSPLQIPPPPNTLELGLATPRHDDSSNLLHGTEQIQPSGMHHPQEPNVQGNVHQHHSGTKQTHPTSLQIPMHDFLIEKSTEPTAEISKPKMSDRDAANIQESLQIPIQISGQQIGPSQSQPQIGRRVGSAFSEYRGKENQGSQGEASASAQPQSSTLANLQEQPNPTEGGQHETVGQFMQLLNRPLTPDLQIDEQEEHSNVDGDEQQEITKLGLGLSGQKRGPSDSDGKGKDEEGPSGQKKAKKG